MKYVFCSQGVICWISSARVTHLGAHRPHEQACNNGERGIGVSCPQICSLPPTIEGLELLATCGGWGDIYITVGRGEGGRHGYEVQLLYIGPGYYLDG